jgi:integrase
MGKRRGKDPMNGIYIDRRWEYWVYRPYLGSGKKGKPVKLVPMDRPASDALKAREALLTPQENTFEALSLDYLKSPKFRKKAPTTKEGYRRSHNQLCNMSMTDGRKFGQYRSQDITKTLLREYLDWFIVDDEKYKKGYVLANRHISYIDSVFCWAIECEKVKHNPAKITKNVEKSRDHYVEDVDYYHAMYIPGPDYLPFVMELAYLCRARKDIEVLNIKLKDDGKHPFVTPDGIYLRRGKGSKTQLIAFTPRLKETVEQAKKLYGISSIHLVHDREGQRIKKEAIKSAWQRKMVVLKAAGGTPFTIHDLKHKGVTDFDGDKAKATGDWSAGMRKVYDQSVEIIASTK